MAPKSKSHKASSGVKAKLTSSTSNSKIKKNLLKGSKQAASPHMKENIKKFKKKDFKPAVFSGGKENYEAQMKKLKAENDALRMTLAVKDRATATTAANTIPRPESGASSNLQEIMGLADDSATYAILRRTVRDLAAKAGLDCALGWHKQPKDLISKIIGMARERHNYFKKFPHGWVVEEFLKTHLKNKRAYARRRGYLGDRTNQGLDGDGDCSDQGSNGDKSDSEDVDKKGGDGDESRSEEDEGNDIDDVKQGGDEHDDIYGSGDE